MDLSPILGIAGPDTGEGAERVDSVSGLHGAHSSGIERSERSLDPR